MTNEAIEFNPEFTPEELLESIDLKYDQLKGKENRLSLKWGHFSRGMNLAINAFCRQLPMGSQIREKYMYVQIYWTCKSRLLDLYMKSSLLSRGRKRREEKMAKDIKKMILSGDFLTPSSEDERIASFLRKL